MLSEANRVTENPYAPDGWCFWIPTVGLWTVAIGFIAYCQLLKLM